MGTKKNTVALRFVEIADKAIRIQNFLPLESSNIQKPTATLKLLNFQILNLYVFVKHYFETKIPNSSINYFKKSSSQYPHRTCSVFKNCAFLPKVSTDTYGRNSIKYQCIHTGIIIKSN